MLEVRGCSKSFKRSGQEEFRALDDVTFCVRPGEFVAVLGSNGAGKSTLLNCISGSLLPERGQIVVDGEDLTKKPSFRRARSVWTIRQNPEVNVLSKFTIEENLALVQAYRSRGLSIGRLLTKERRLESQRALASLGMGLEGRMHDLGGSLSGGQRQATAVAMGLLAKPRLLLLDEHVAALDPRSARAVMNATRAMVRDQRMTAVMVTHNLQHAVEAASRVIIMHRGRIAADLQQGTTELTVPDLIEAFEEATEGELPDAIRFGETEDETEASTSESNVRPISVNEAS